jgi:hypothetical protein
MTLAGARYVLANHMEGIMPFDNTNYVSEKLQLLRIGLQRLEQGWVQRSLSRRGDFPRYCMMGAFVCDDSGNEIIVDKTPSKRTPVVREILTAIASKIVAKNTAKHRFMPYFSGDPGGIIVWNDNARRTHQEVVDLVREVVKEQEEFEGITAQ